MNEESRISRLGCNRFPNVSDQFPKTEWSLEHTSITEEWPKDRRFENFTLCQESAALYMLITGNIINLFVQRFFRLVHQTHALVSSQTLGY